MKKLILLFAVATALAMAGCSFHEGCTVTLNIVNRTNAEITLVLGYEGTSELSITPGGEATADEGHGRCGKNEIPPDDYPEDYRLLDFEARKLMVDGKIVSGEIWARKYWDVVREVYHSTYTRRSQTN